MEKKVVDGGKEIPIIKWEPKNKEKRMLSRLFGSEKNPISSDSNNDNRDVIREEINTSNGKTLKDVSGCKVKDRSNDEQDNSKENLTAIPEHNIRTECSNIDEDSGDVKKTKQDSFQDHSSNNEVNYESDNGSLNEGNVEITRFNDIYNRIKHTQETFRVSIENANQFLDSIEQRLNAVWNEYGDELKMSDNSPERGGFEDITKPTIQSKKGAVQRHENIKQEEDVVQHKDVPIVKWQPKKKKRLVDIVKTLKCINITKRKQKEKDIRHHDESIDEKVLLQYAERYHKGKSTDKTKKKSARLKKAIIGSLTGALIGASAMLGTYLYTDWECMIGKAVALANRYNESEYSWNEQGRKVTPSIYSELEKRIAEFYPVVTDEDKDFIKPLKVKIQNPEFYRMLLRFIPYVHELPKIPDNLKDLMRIISMKTSVYSEDLKEYHRMNGVKKEFITFSNIPPKLLEVLVNIEDKRFFEHHGIDKVRLLGAVKNNILYNRMEGASTLTQQLAKNLFLYPKKNLKRKIEEMLIALAIEQAYSKQEILEYYINNVYLGNGYYGFQAAARGYFGKDLWKLDLNEITTLVGMLKAPGHYYLHSKKGYERAIERRNLLLKILQENGYIDRMTYKQLKESKLKVKMHKEDLNMHPYATNTALNIVSEQLGKNIFKSIGLNIYTTIDDRMQGIAEGVVREYGKKYPDYEIALVTIENKTGEIKAIVGGNISTKSLNEIIGGFNRAVDAKRQVGSAIKPVIAATAVEDLNLYPGSVISSKKITYKVKSKDGKEKEWEVADRKDIGDEITLRDALRLSSNRAFVNLFMKMNHDKVYEKLKLMGIDRDIEDTPSFVLGTYGFSPLEMAAIFATLANNGVYHEPYIIEGIKVGNKAFKAKTNNDGVKVFEPESAFMVTNMLQDVVNKGTARKAKIDNIVCAGKTGTTNDNRDTWFIGYTPKYTTAVWVGRDDFKPLGKKMYGGNVAAPIWHDYMEQVINKVKNKSNKNRFEKPENIIRVNVDINTGYVTNKDMNHEQEISVQIAGKSYDYFEDAYKAIKNAVLDIENYESFDSFIRLTELSNRLQDLPVLPRKPKLIKEYADRRHVDDYNIRATIMYEKRRKKKLRELKDLINRKIEETVKRSLYEPHEQF